MTWQTLGVNASSVSHKKDHPIDLATNFEKEMMNHEDHENSRCKSGDFTANRSKLLPTQARSVLLRPRALYFFVQHKTG